MGEILLILTVAITSIGGFVLLAVFYTKFFKYFLEVVKDINEENKKDKF
tara:strand:+ start:2003 stop:2149 length:147 start_codon:yes stop_codon:yes gene_type:complete